MKRAHKIKKMKLKVAPEKLLVPGIILFLLVVLGMTWQFTPLGEMATPEKMADMVKRFADQPAAPFMMAGLIILSQLVFMPLIVMTLATAMVFGPVEGILISLAGACGSAAVTYGFGALMGKRAYKLMGGVLKKVRARLDSTGLVGLIVLRFIPVAPYSVMNIAIGVIGVPFVTFITACFLELLPGCIIRAFLGGAISNLWKNPDAHNISIVAFGLLVWLGIVFGCHKFAQHYRNRHGHHGHAVHA